jgi:hypothetical protein
MSNIEPTIIEAARASHDVIVAAREVCLPGSFPLEERASCAASEATR